jgi:hypothetical protein
MAWTYDPTQMLSATGGTYSGSTVGVRNQIRFVVQDVQTSRQLLQDAEIDWVQTLEANAYMMAALCCEILVARAGNIKSKSVDGLKLEYDVEFYRGLAATLRARGLTNQMPYCGGLSISDKLAQQDDPDWVPVRFFRGMFDNPRAVQPSASVESDPTSYPGGY